MPNIRHEVIISAPPETVYDALTSSEGLAGWWTPGAKAKPERDSIARFPFGPNYLKEMKITRLDPPKRVQWTCLKGADEWVGTTLSFELHSGDKEGLSRSRPEALDQIRQGSSNIQTLLVFGHDDWRAYTPMFAECSYTWGRFLRSLKLFCETGHGQPWPEQHRAAA